MVSLTEEVTVLQRREGAEGGSLMNIWGRLFGQKAGACGVCLRNSKEAKVAGAERMDCGVSGGREVPRSQLSKSLDATVRFQLSLGVRRGRWGSRAEEGCGQSWFCQDPSGCV